MTNPTGIVFPIGFRNCVIFALNAAGLPNATSTSTPYEGVRVTGNKALTINDPEPRRITHIGDDAVEMIDVLPPQEAMSIELHVGKHNDVVDAVVTGQKQYTIGESANFDVGTDMRGFEPQVGMLAYQQGNEGDPTSALKGLRAWGYRVIHKAFVITREVGFSDQPLDKTYNVVPAPSASHLLGFPFTTATHGDTSATISRGVAWNKPKLIAWLADGTEDEFTLPAASPAVATTKMAVYDNGTVVTTGVTKTTTKLTFAPVIAAGHIITLWYETL